MQRDAADDKIENRLSPIVLVSQSDETSLKEVGDVVKWINDFEHYK